MVKKLESFFIFAYKLFYWEDMYLKMNLKKKKNFTKWAPTWTKKNYIVSDSFLNFNIPVSNDFFFFLSMRY